MAGKKRAELAIFLQTAANSHIFFRFIVKNGGGGTNFPYICIAKCAYWDALRLRLNESVIPWQSLRRT